MMLWRAALVAGTVLAATPAQGHAFGARYDLPLPLALYLGAAGLAVAVSFIGVLGFQRTGQTRGRHIDLQVPARVARTVSRLLGFVGVFGLAVLLGAAFTGPQEPTRNFATVVIWVIWWVGFLLFSALVASIWPQIDPFRTLAALVSRAVGRPWTRGGVPSLAGWLAPAGLFVMAWVELVSDWSEDPFAMGVLVTGYLAGAILGGLAFGREWFRVADPLGRIFGVLGRMAPLSANDLPALRLRPPGEGFLDASDPPRGEVALVTGLIAIVLFDGISETPAWAAVLDFVSGSQALRPSLLWLLDRGADLMKLIRSMGLFTTAAMLYGAYWLLVMLMRKLAGGVLPTRHLAGKFAGILLPIAVAYHLAHYTSYLLIAGQLAIPAASDPFGLGWNVFGTRDRSIDIGVIGARQIWWIAFAALVVGHALSVILGHRRALQVFGDPRRAAISQVPMTAAMVGLTVLSLWILAQPITEA